MGFYLKSHAPYAVTANENAVFEEMESRARARTKAIKIEEFKNLTRMRVKERLLRNKTERLNYAHDIEEEIKKIIKTAIEFSVRTNAITQGQIVGDPEVLTLGARSPKKPVVAGGPEEQQRKVPVPDFGGKSSNTQMK